VIRVPPILDGSLGSRLVQQSHPWNKFFKVQSHKILLARNRHIASSTTQTKSCKQGNVRNGAARGHGPPSSWEDSGPRVREGIFPRRWGVGEGLVQTAPSTTLWQISKSLLCEDCTVSLAICFLCSWILAARILSLSSLRPSFKRLNTFPPGMPPS
jgi:hypothetical protein